MKNYTSPEVEIVTVDATDVITTSIGTEAPEIDLGYGGFAW